MSDDDFDADDFLAGFLVASAGDSPRSKKDKLGCVIFFLVDAAILAAILWYFSQAS